MLYKLISLTKSKMVKLNELTEEKISQMSKEDLVDALKSVKTQAIKANKKIESMVDWEKNPEKNLSEAEIEKILERKEFIKSHNLNEDEIKALDEIKWENLTYQEALEIARLRDENFANQQNTNQSMIDGKDGKVETTEALTYSEFENLWEAEKANYLETREKVGWAMFKVSDGDEV